MTPEERRIYMRAYRQKNKDKITARINEWRAQNAERFAESKRQWRLNNLEKARAIACAGTKRWRLRNPGKDAAYRAEHKDEGAALAKRWYDANKEKKLAQNKAWRDTNKDRMRALTNEWAKQNPLAMAEHRVAGAHRRRGRLRALATHFTSQELTAHRAKYGKKCAICRVRGRLTLDHIIALANGGSNTINNIQFLCQPCNSSKGTRDPIEFAQSRGLLV